MYFLLDFERIFAGLSISSRVSVKKAIIKIYPFNPKTDQLSMLGDEYKKNTTYSIKNNTMEIEYLGSSTEVWNKIINYPAYRLNLDVSKIIHILIIDS